MTVPLRHPPFCDDQACLCTPIQGSQSWWYAGHHRGGVRALSTDYGPLIETSIAQDETFDCDYPVGVHLRLLSRETAEELGHVELTPDEAEQLAATLLERAHAARVNEAAGHHRRAASA